ncbi:MAG: flagellin [Pararhodobacter sp.]|nr:flagellin [Pararhodobacter sp.]
MSSILTNTSAMVALQTMRGINRDMADTQNQIATGMKVGSAKDNAAVWAISRVMESDVQGFKAIQESLSLGESTVAVARQATETVTSLLTEMKGKIVAAQEENVDRAKIQTDITQLQEQISSVVNSAQFNGLNLVNGASSNPVNVLSSLDRAADGTVSSSAIAVTTHNLTTTAAQFGDGDSLAANLTVDGLTGADEVAAGADTGALTFGGNIGTNGGEFDVVITVGGETITLQTATLDDNATAAEVADAIRAAVNGSENAALQGINLVAGGTGAELEFSMGGSFEDVTIDVSDVVANSDLTGADANGWEDQAQTLGATAATVEFDSSAEINAGDSYRVTVGSENFDYVAGAGDSFEDVADGLAALVNAAEGFEARVTEDGGTFTLEVVNTSGTDAAFAADGAEDGQAAGGLFAMAGLNVTTQEGAQQALDDIEALIQFSIDAAAGFGSAQARIEIQSDFVGNLIDSLNTGIGTLIDADMEAQSARLQALQVQQQLATQSLSIANQAPQNLLALFR